METFLYIVGGVLIMVFTISIVKFAFTLIFKTVVGSVVGISVVLYGIFLFVR